MTAIATSARARGLDALRSATGETLTFRGKELVAVVRRDVEELNSEGFVDFTDRKASIVRVRFLDLATKPLNEERFTDADDVAHRIRLVKTGDLHWDCYCAVEP
jgi:hypothetical protein